MKRTYSIRKTWMIIEQLGLNPLKFCNFLMLTPSFVFEYFRFKEDLKKINSKDNLIIFPMLSDKVKFAGNIDIHYFYQDLHIASKIFQNNPKKHVDIGSRIDGFVAHVASFREIEVFDIRPLELEEGNIKFFQFDIMTPDPHFFDYCDSISSLHVIEHLGLGRYGDKLDYYGYLKGLDTIYNMLKHNGKFYFSVPIGKPRIEFNANRVFDIITLLSIFKGKYLLDSFSYINDSGKLIKNVDLNSEEIKNNFNLTYGCGIFELTKI